MTSGFSGRHYETGTVVNVLAAMGVTNPRTGKPYSEALALGASGGIAFGYFVFEYEGHLPHVALLTRNTFSPFERMLDNLGIRRETKETTSPEKGEKNLQTELDCGNPTLVWADRWSRPYTGLKVEEMWNMQPLLVLGTDGTDYIVADGSERAVRLSSEDMSNARSRVKKDRFRIMTIEAPDESRVADGLLRGLETCVSLFLDKPPAGSANNFGISGMRYWAKMLTDKGTAKGWAKTFAPGPRLSQALAGRHGQPGVWDWIESWVTQGGADRGLFADFLVEAADWTGRAGLADSAPAFRESAGLWHQLAEASMPDSAPQFTKLKELKRRHREVWVELGMDSLAERASIRAQMTALVAELAEPAVLAPHSESVRDQMSEIVLKIADIEEQAVRDMREALSYGSGAT